MTNCQIIIGQGAKLQNLTIVTSNTSASSISGASGIQFGVNDNCAPGGATQIVSGGKIDTNSHITMGFCGASENFKFEFVRLAM